MAPDAESRAPQPLSEQDVADLRRQLGRPVRGTVAVAHRCPCGSPDVIETHPRLPDGSPFPTLYYVTCPRLNAAVGRLEGAGIMSEMEDRLDRDPALARNYAEAHEQYLQRRQALGDVPEIAGVSAGGMPDRVKCLHALAGQALARGPGVNRLGDEVVDRVGRWWIPDCREPVVAAIDCGTNSLRLLVARRVGAGLVELDRQMRTVRLGEGVDRTGAFAAAALQRAFAVCREYRDVITARGVREIRFVATSATRDASNSQEFRYGVESILGVLPEIISGEEEAALSFSGALLGARFEPPVLVFDIGGGSTEFILGGREPSAAVSVDMGCVRFSERFGVSDPATAAEVDAVRAAAERMLDEVEDVVALRNATTVVGLAGTVTTVAALALGLDRYDSTRIHGASVPASAVARVAAQLVALTTAERAALPVMHPGRADVVAVGAVILDAIVRRTGAAEIVASEHDILDGVAWSIVRDVPR